MAALSLRLSGVRCSYGRVVAVDGVDLSVEPGEHVAIVGANGSGKTTLGRAILGLHPLAGGRISVGGREAVTTKDWAERRRLVAWVPQRQATGRFPLLVRELLASSGRLPEALDAAAILGVADLAERPLHTLSGGQLQRAFLARGLGCLAAGAGVLLADEPTAALDFDTKATVARLLAELEVTVLVISHDQEMAVGKLREAA